ncbi:hypothetical protein GXP67_02775 [Rhodocytophaga rosea]|uniref:Uncharacterized protein n=1 Tax=Rhodocytophaga rosea TaxID=2704465 RepID=A0A6C0GCT8_9BACT|nr:hypothetical protein [Rhodocytophaga rosea]QHT65664.1 hypothetical protein GXP67_02775 [Rhodocytophaga rosea]
MEKINLQSKTKAEKGIAEKYWFENSDIGLSNTLFHRICIPLTPFDSGLEYESQPVETEIVIEWLNLKLQNPDELNNLTITSQAYEELEASVYIGGAHNMCDVKRLEITKKENDNYLVKGELLIDFQSEGVGENEAFNFQTEVNYQKD